jgi:hypothetical protein
MPTLKAPSGAASDRLLVIVRVTIKLIANHANQCHRAATLQK